MRPNLRRPDPEYRVLRTNSNDIHNYLILKNYLWIIRFGDGRLQLNPADDTMRSGKNLA
jgi:hypothetical protein